jgi:hypothetical protein
MPKPGGVLAAPGAAPPAEAAALPPSPAAIRGAQPGAAAQPDQVGRVEAALKALRQARDPEARRRATDALEKAVKQLRGRPTEPGKPSGAPQIE